MPRTRLKLSSSLLISVAISLSLDGCTSVPTGRPVAQTATQPYAVVMCICPTMADRQRTAEAVRRRGATINQLFGAITGFVIQLPPGVDVETFRRRLARLRDVTGVLEDESVELRKSPIPD